jgi:DNA-binding IclR family transcriptional regulator
MAGLDIKAAAAGEIRSVKSAERVFDVLEVVSASPNGENFMQLSKLLGIPKSSLHALLDVMVRRQYLEIDGEAGRYTLGVRTLEVGQAFVRRHDLIEVARQAMTSLVAEINETAQLARLSGRENVYLARVDSSHALRLLSEPGTRLPAHATGVGKALLAQLDHSDIVSRFGSGALPSYTATTHRTVASLEDELGRTRARGFAIDNEEYTPGVFCLAVPVFGHSGEALASMSVSVPVSRASRMALCTILARLAQHSLAVSQRMGALRPDPKLAELADQNAARKGIEALVTSPIYRLPFD